MGEFTMQTSNLGLNGAPPGSNFQTVNIMNAMRNLEDLWKRVTAGCGRVEIVDGKEGISCVLISKAELDSLEEALAILSTTEGAELMRERLSAVASASMRGSTLPVIPVG